MLPIEIKNFEESIKEIMSPKDVELNLQAFRKGVELTRGEAVTSATLKIRKRK
jgi:Pyruvate/2-oxoacid:ferredoxin oxidoreductase gamma subunit